MISMFDTRVAAALVLCAVVTGCRAPAPPVGPAGTTMIVEPREVRFNPETVRRVVSVEIPDLVAEGVDGWSARQDDPVTFAGDRIEVSGGRDFVSLTREVEWQADDIDALQLEISNLDPSARGLRFYWADPDGRFSESRTSRAIERENEITRVPLVGQPNWDGRVSKIRIDLPVPARGKTTVRSIRPMRFEYDQEKIISAAESHWKVDLKDDLRNAGLVAAHRPLTWTFDEPRGGFLEFSYGILESASRQASVVAAVQDRLGKWTSVFEGRHPDESNGAGGGWSEARVDLRSHGPIQAVEFRLVTEGGGSPSAGLGAIANPVVVASTSRASRANVVLISLDTLRADRLSSYGYEKVTSPLLDSRAEESGVLFRNAVAPSPRTLPSHTTILTGLDCVSHGVNHHTPAPAELQTLAEVLRDEGYRTVATVGGGLLDPNFGLAQGFDEYFHYSGWAGGFEELEVELAEAVEKLERGRGRPFFLFFHTYEIHDPYHQRAPFSDACFQMATEQPPEDLIYGAMPRPRAAEEQYLLSFDLKKWSRGRPVSSATLVPTDELDLVNCLYDSAISYVDVQIDRLLDHLDELGVLDDTLIVVTSDHGEALGEKGLFKHAYLYENNLMVPLIFFLPGGRAGGFVVDQQVGSVDIYPTILDVLGIDVPRQIDGRSLLPLIRGEDDAGPAGVWSYAAYENRGVSLRIDNQVKYIFNNSVHPEVSQSQELYQLSDDAEELTNLVDKDPETAERLRQRLVTYYRSATPSANLTMENTGCESVHGTIRIASLMTHVKAVEAVRGKLRNVSENRVEIDIDQGEDLRFFVESSKRIGIDLQAQGCGVDGTSAKLRRSIDVEEAKAGLFLGLTDSGWKGFESSELLESAVTAATLVLGGSERERGAGDDVMEEERVLEQLRSLGYIQ